MKRLAIVTVLASLLFSSGCMTLDRGFTPNKPVREYAAPNVQKQAVTYCVKTYFYNFVSEFKTDTDTKITERIHDGLVNSGLYSSVEYAEKPSPGKLHYEFVFHYWVTNPGLSFGLAFASFFDAFLIPTYLERTLDGYVTVFDDTKRVRSDGTAEVVQLTNWLPLIVVAPILNPFVGFYVTERGVVNALINKSSDYTLSTLSQKPTLKE